MTFRYFYSCFHVPGTLNKGETHDIVCGQSVQGQFVFVVLNGRDYLTLCEVEVLGLKGKGSSNTYTQPRANGCVSQIVTTYSAKARTKYCKLRAFVNSSPSIIIPA